MSNLWDGQRERRLLVFLSPELLCAVIKQLLIHLHEKLQSVVDEAVDGPARTAGTSHHSLVFKTALG